MRGFTLIEMLIVLAIIGIITAIVITSHGAFNKSLLLSNAAYDLALAIRSTESYGLGSRVSTALADNTGYGLSFTAGNSVNTFILFADSDPASVVPSNCHGMPITGAASPDAKIGNCIYTAADQLITAYTLNNGITVSKACAYNGTWSCTSGTATTFTRLNIVFARPEPAPFISTDVAGYSTAFTRACITLVSKQGGERFVAVNATGQIDAAATNCPTP